VLWLLTGLLFLPLVGGGLFGANLVTGALNTMLSLAIVGLVFGLLFVFIHNWFMLRLMRQGERSPDEQAKIEEETGRRNLLLRRGLVVAGLGILGWAAWRFIAGTSTGGIAQDTESNLLSHYKSKVPAPAPNYGAITRVPNLSPAITPNGQFYVVSKNFVSDPTVNGATWQLRVDGAVQRPYTLNYAEVMALPRNGQYESLMCISNDVGGPYMSNAYWEGIPLHDLLERAGGVKPGATKVVFHSADDYSDSIHLSKALEPTTMMALRMNGETLPQGHGFPARMLVPGIYGMKHAKWLTHIEVVNYDFQGYWQQSGWSDSANVRMTSRIDTPLQNATVKANKMTYIAGVAFSGNKGIGEVDVSFDNGQLWQRATLQRPFSDLTWVLWEISWQPKAGIYTILVRAIDLQGNVQDPHSAPPLPDGSSGYHSVTIKAA
jgi:DMSO/TMAO reductase YedYZ molybdopterin-dependent catalytic subunit